MAANWGQAKIQILALKPEIEAALKSGKTVAAIYEDLRACHRVTMSSVTFYRWCRRLRAANEKRTAQEIATQLPASTSPSNRLSPTSSTPARTFPTYSNETASSLVGQLAPEDENVKDLM